MARDAGGAILALGLLGLGYVLYKKGTLSKIGLPTTQTSKGTPGVPVSIPPGTQFPGIQGTQFGLQSFPAVFGTDINSTAPGSPAVFEDAPGKFESGTVNSTGGFTAKPDPNGIGGGFAT